MNIKTAFISIALSLLLVSCGSKAVETPSVDMYAPGVGGGAPEMGNCSSSCRHPIDSQIMLKLIVVLVAMPPPPVARPSRNAW